MRLICFCALSAFSLLGCTNSELKEVESQEVDSTKKENSAPEFTVITIELPEGGWGYQILQDGTLAIDQKHIPAIQGYKGFSTKEKAEITANFSVGKMKRGIFPPTLSEEELDSLGVL